MRRAFATLPMLFACLALWMGANVAHASPSRTDLQIVSVLSAPALGWILVVELERSEILALDAATLATQRSFHLPDDDSPNLQVHRMTLSADGRSLYVVTAFPGILVIIDLATGDMRRLMLMEDGRSVVAGDVAEWTPERALVLTGGKQPLAEVDLASGQVLRRFPGGEHSRELVLDRAHHRAFLGGYRTTRIDLNGLEAPLVARFNSSGRLQLSPDGALLGTDGLLLSTETLEIVDRPVFNGHSPQSPANVVFGSPDGRGYIPYFDAQRYQQTIGVIGTQPAVPSGRIVIDCPNASSQPNLSDGVDGNSLIVWHFYTLCVVPKAVRPLLLPERSPGGTIQDVLADRTRVLAAIPSRNEVVVFRAASLTILRRLYVPGTPTRLIRAADGRRVFVTLDTVAGIAEINLATLEVTTHRLPLPEYTRGLSDAALMASGDLLVQGSLGQIGVLEDGPDHALRWLDIPYGPHWGQLLFDAARSYLYVSPSIDNRIYFGRVDLTDLDNPTVALYSRLANGAAIGNFALNAGMKLSRDGKRLATDNGRVFNPLTMQPVKDLGSQPPWAFGRDGNTYLVAAHDAQRGRTLVPRYALSSGKLLSTSTLRCAAGSRLYYIPEWDDVIGVLGAQMCTRRALTGYDGPQVKPLERIPSPALLQPLDLGTRLTFVQAGRKREVSFRRGQGPGVPRGAVQAELNSGNTEYYSTTNQAFRMLGGKLVDGDETILYLFQSPLDLLRRGDSIRAADDGIGSVLLRNQEGKSGYASYTFRRRLRGYEQVKVPAGRFRALRVDYVLRMYQPGTDVDQSEVWTTWYVPGLGQVKEIHRGRSAVELLTLPPMDADRDGLPFRRDNCPQVRSSNVLDLDRDGIGDVCDTDDDGDSIDDLLDNCPRRANRNQADANLDGLGDACTGARR